MSNETPASSGPEFDAREAAPSPMPASAAVDSRAIEELDAAICRLARHLHSQTYRLLVLILEFDERLGWAKWSYKNCAEWLAWRCQLSISAAREKVRTAHALRELPAVSAALAAGKLSYSKVRALTRVGHLADENDLLDYALQATAAQVEERCRQIRNVTPESTETARRAWERRALTVARNPSRSTLLISVELPAEDGELIVRALESAVGAGEVALGAEYIGAYGADRAGRDRSRALDGWRAQQADALVAVARAYLAARGRRNGAGRAAAGPRSGLASEPAASPSTTEAAAQSFAATAAAAGEPSPKPSAEVRASSLPDHYQVVVHVDEHALRGGPGRSDAPIETVKRLLCDGSLMPVVEDAQGTPLALGRKRRVVTTSLRRLLWARDRGCTFPGCGRRDRYVDAHHVQHWIDGGKTDADNTVLLCSWHHRLLHEGRFSMRRRDGHLEFRRADGRVIPRSGYRREDIVDDTADESMCVEGSAAPSAEGFRTPMEHDRSGHGPTSVREPQGVYRVSAPAEDVHCDQEHWAGSHPHRASQHTHERDRASADPKHPRELRAETQSRRVTRRQREQSESGQRQNTRQYRQRRVPHRQSNRKTEGRARIPVPTSIARRERRKAAALDDPIREAKHELVRAFPQNAHFSASLSMWAEPPFPRSATSNTLSSFGWCKPSTIWDLTARGGVVLSSVRLALPRAPAGRKIR